MLFPNVCLVSAGRFVWHAHDDQTHFKRWIDVMLPAFEQAGIDLTPIFQALIGFLAALVTYKFVPWIQARTTAQQQEMLRAAVSVAVYAAEQLYGAGKGKEKLTYVIGQLAKKGYHVDKDEIEAAVRELTVISV